MIVEKTALGLDMVIKAYPTVRGAKHMRVTIILCAAKKPVPLGISFRY